MIDAPPRLARWLAAALVPEPEREYVLGDMAELYKRDFTADGRSHARARYWRQTLGLARHRIPRSFINASATQPRRTFDMSSLWRDFIVGARTAWHSKTYSAITILTLALAIGANTVIFSIANPLVIRELPIANPGTLGWIRTMNVPRQIDRGLVSAPDFLEYRERAHSFSSLAGYEVTAATLTGHQTDPERITIIRGTGNLTDVWGMKPVLGRTFITGDDAPNQPLPAVISFHFWRDRFQQRDDVLGRQLLIDGRPLVIVGVMPLDVELGTLALVDMWTPTTLDPDGPRDLRTLRVMGQLAPGATLASANAEIVEIARQQAAADPNTHADWSARVLSTRQAALGNNTMLVLTLLAIVVGFVLLIACANLANLVMSRLTARALDLAVRQALGASRWQLVRPLVAEGLLLSVVGGALGVAVANGGLRLIKAVAYEPIFRQLTIDRNVFAFAAALTLVAPILFSVLPGLATGRAVRVETLRDSRSSGGRAVKRRRNVLVAGQVALALSLLIMSTLAARSMMYLRAIPVGLDVSKMAMFRYELPEDRYADDAARARFADALTSRLAGLGGVTAAAVASHLPVFDEEVTRQVEGLAQSRSEHDQPWVSWYSITPDFFRTTGVAMLSGRAIAPDDRSGTEPVVVINRLAAERYFGSVGAALGRKISLTGQDEAARSVTVVGVAADTRAPQLTTTSPQAYVPFAQWPAREVTALVRSDAPAARMSDMRAVMRALEPAVPIVDLRTIADRADDEQSSNVILNGLFISFALLALALAAGGLYGVISYSVGQRTREIGLRMALGADPAGISRLVLSEGLKVTGAGVVVGLLLGVAIAKLAAPILEGVAPTDPATFAAGTAVVLITAVISILGPALRAMRLDPARTLRAD